MYISNRLIMNSIKIKKVYIFLLINNLKKKKRSNNLVMRVMSILAISYHLFDVVCILHLDDLLIWWEKLLKIVVNNLKGKYKYEKN